MAERQIRSMALRVDHLAVPLAAGLAPDVWGLNVNATSPPSAELVKHYVDFIAKLRTLLPADDLECMHIYQPQHLHMTVASPAPFTGKGSEVFPESRDRDAVASAWVTAMRDTLARDGPWAPFPVTFRRVELFSNAAVMLADDPSDGVVRLRNSIARCSSNAELEALGALRHEVEFKMPSLGFNHSTFIRLVKLPCDEAAFRSRFAAAVEASWTPITVMVDHVRLVNEVKPYMHLDVEEMTVARFELS